MSPLPSRRCPTPGRGARIAALLLALAAGACVPPPEPMRGAGDPCARTEDCNPTGMTCGSLRICVAGVCSGTPVLRACAAPPADASRVGNCLSVEDCNPLPRCGQLVGCTLNACDVDGPRIEVPCTDGGAPDVRDAAAPDARQD